MHACLSADVYQHCALGHINPWWMIQNSETCWPLRITIVERQLAASVLGVGSLVLSIGSPVHCGSCLRTAAGNPGNAQNQHEATFPKESQQPVCPSMECHTVAMVCNVCHHEHLFPPRTWVCTWRKFRFITLNLKPDMPVDVAHDPIPTAKSVNPMNSTNLSEPALWEGAS